MNNDAETNVGLQASPLVVPQSNLGRGLYRVIALVLPVVCFSVSTIVRPLWQDGKYSSYIMLLLDPQAAKFFFPALLYSMFSLALLLAAPTRFAASFPIRLGIYTGVLLALQYMLILFVAQPFSAGAVAVGGAFVLLDAGFRKLNLSRNIRAALILGLGLIAVLGAAVWLKWPIGRALVSMVEISPYGIPALILLLAPPSCFLVMTTTAVKLFREYERPVIFSVWRGAGVAAWLAGFVAAWAFSIQEMFKIYASLSPYPPNCYIATAAAQGHSGFVGSQAVDLPTGARWVNPQLRYLKCAELALLALAPGLHRPLRTVYDLLGCPLARRLTHPLLADLAYLSLKPFELLARFLLRLLIPSLDEFANRLYR